jgi:hypothetical protein
VALGGGGGVEVGVALGGGGVEVALETGPAADGDVCELAPPHAAAVVATSAVRNPKTIRRWKCRATGVGLCPLVLITL